MNIHRPHCTALLSATLISLAAFPSVAGAASGLPHKVIARTPYAAVRASVIGNYDPRYNPYTCSTQLPMHRIVAWSTCPFTTRFWKRLMQGGHANRGVELCGNQYPPRTVRLHTIFKGNALARINARWDLAPTNTYTSTFVVIRSGSSWLVDNIYMAGRPSADIYHEGATPFCP